MVGLARSLVITVRHLLGVWEGVRGRSADQHCSGVGAAVDDVASIAAVGNTIAVVAVTADAYSADTATVLMLLLLLLYA